MRKIKETESIVKVPFPMYGLAAYGHISILNEGAYADIMTPIVSIRVNVDMSKTKDFIYKDGTIGPFDMHRLTAKDMTFDALGNEEIVSGIKACLLKTIGKTVVDTMAIIPTLTIKYLEDNVEKLMVNTPEVHIVSRYPFLHASQCVLGSNQYMQLPSNIQDVYGASHSIVGNIMGNMGKNQNIASSLPVIYGMLSKSVNAKVSAGEIFSGMIFNEFEDIIDVYNTIMNAVSSDKDLIRIGKTVDPNDGARTTLTATRVPRFYVHEMMRPTDYKVVDAMENNARLRTTTEESELPWSGSRAVTRTPFLDDEVTDVIGGYYVTAIANRSVFKEREELGNVSNNKAAKQQQNQQTRGGADPSYRPGRKRSAQTPQPGYDANVPEFKVGGGRRRSFDQAADIQTNGRRSRRAEGENNGYSVRGRNQNMQNGEMLIFEPVFNTSYIHWRRLNDSVRPV